MRVLFIGSVAFSEKTLEKLIDLKVNLVGVVTKKSSSFNADFVDLSKTADAHSIDFHYTKNVNDQKSVNWIESKEPDLIFCLGWSQLLKKEILNIPPRGVVGYHPAKIPENRGRHPLIWAIALGLNETASTFFMMDEGADTGDIISQESFKILHKDYAADVYKRMIETALGQIEEIVSNLQSNKIVSVPQNPENGNSWRKRGKEDGKVDFRISSENIYNLVRALSKPYIGAHIEYQGSEIKVWKTVPDKCNAKNIEPGKILDLDENKIKVKTGDSAVWLTEHEFDILPEINTYI